MIRSSGAPKCLALLVTILLLATFLFAFGILDDQATPIASQNWLPSNGSSLKGSINRLTTEHRKSFFSLEDEVLKDEHVKYGQSKCTLSSCFNLNRCVQGQFSVYVYPEPYLVKSSIFKKILQSLNSSPYYTADPAEACLFVASVDTLDRDRLSDNYVANLSNTTADNPFARLPHSNQTGANHLIFNLYSGTWPFYIDDDLDLNRQLIQNAILVKTSFSVKTYRKDFDISFPLFHADLPATSTLSLESAGIEEESGPKKYLLTFKGKRYLNGIGTETRNAIFHLNNARDILMLTTCKHIDFKKDSL